MVSKVFFYDNILPFFAKIPSGTQALFCIPVSFYHKIWSFARKSFTHFESQQAGLSASPEAPENTRLPSPQTQRNT